MAMVVMAAADLLPLRASMSPFSVARLLATIPRKLAAAFTLPIFFNKIVGYGSTLKEEILPLT